MEENEFWLKFWTLFTIVLVVLICSIYYGFKHHQTLRAEAWNNCVSAGGQPMSQPMIGTSDTTFTCVRK